MKRNTVVALSVILVFAFVISLARPGFAEQKKMQSIEGKILCVEPDQQGHLTAVEKSNCKGLSVLVGKDGKLYSLYGSEGKMKEMAMEGKVSGEVEGSQRAWIIYAGGVRPSQKPVEEAIRGTVFCLLPNYENGTVTPVIASGPCNELPPHAHAILAEDGKVYALEGSEEGIHKLEMTPQRQDVKIKGKVQGNPGGWILFVE